MANMMIISTIIKIIIRMIKIIIVTITMTAIIK